MNDPWDVKSVRQSGQYMSCMKINGIPLLPPVLSKECRKEMQYYKLLAKEVEKRISMLQPYISDNDSETSEDKTDAPELPENEENSEITKAKLQPDIKKDKIDQVDTEKLQNDLEISNFDNPMLQTTDIYSSLQSNITVVEANGINSGFDSPNLIIDLSLNICETKKNVFDKKKIPQHESPSLDLPERDYEHPNNTHLKELITEFDTTKTGKCEGRTRDTYLKGRAVSRNQFPDLSLSQEGPSSLSSKSFTGSLNDIHTDSMRESQIAPKLNRQRSYTLLKPSPQLLAHLEVQSLNTGVAISCISMSESLSNLSTPNKKRRSWDLESAKVKWSSMAMELKQKNLPNKVTTTSVKNQNTRPAVKKSPVLSPPRARSLALEKSRNENLSKSLPKSEPVQRNKKPMSPVRNAAPKHNIKEQPPKPANQTAHTPVRQATQLISESEDPATRVRELYEKIQKQQLLQMATLVEKQKREQMLLQQVFEEQNNLLYKQLQTIYPKSPLDDQQQEVERGPVSLSQLINHKSPDQSLYDSSLSSTLADTSHYISHCDDVLKKSRDITGSIKKQQPKSRSLNGTKIQTPTTPADGSRTRTHSPVRNTSRRLNYDTSASSEREYEPILTDRTNDTMADINVTFPSDTSGDYPNNNIVMNHLCGEEMTVVQTSPKSTVSGNHCRIESTLKSVDRPIHNSARSSVRAAKPKVVHQPTPKEREAATKIVALAKGYLVRRLMRTERVQGIVQTIKDALLCALQLHQDREGIRGADVDLHRRLIQQITAACYTLHDTFVTSTPAERCAMIATDRGRRRSLAARQTPKPFRQTDLMSQSHSGAFPPRSKRPTPASLMTQSNYETFSGKCNTVIRSRYMPSPRRRPWR